MSSCTIALDIGIHGKIINGLLGFKQKLLIGEPTSGGALQIWMHTSVTIQQLKIAGTPAKIFLETCSLVLTFGQTKHMKNMDSVIASMIAYAWPRLMTIL
jgi:hypothetical protein